MLKDYWPVWILSLVLLAVLCVSAYTYPCNECQQQGASEGPPTSSVQRQPQEGGPKANHSERAKFWIKKTIAWPEGVGAVLVLLTLLCVAWQSCETRKAAQATEQSVGAANKEYALAENTAKRELRAYVCIDSSEMRFRTGIPVVRVVIRNCGQTPAYKTHGWIAVEISDYLPTPVLGKPNDAGIQLSSSVVGPGGTVELEGRPTKRATQTDYSDVASGARTVFAYGFIGYEDAFGDSRWTTFRLITSRSESPRVLRMEGTTHFYGLSPDSSGNEAT